MAGNLPDGYPPDGKLFTDDHTDQIIGSIVGTRLRAIEIDARSANPTVTLDFGSTLMRLTLRDADSFEFQLGVRGMGREER
jgi:hypothetical protein